jgi:branched-chain amino acid aminotransferase
MNTIPFDDRDGFIWLDGKMIPWRDAKLHVLSHGLHYASSVFEGERSYNGNIFRLHDHTVRLKKSAEIIGFNIPYTVKEIEDATNEVVAANNITDGYIRPFAWRGSENMSISTPNPANHLAIAAWPWNDYYGSDKLIGIKLSNSKWRRPMPDTAPTESKCSSLYAIGTMAKNDAEALGCEDAMMLTHKGLVAETSGANIFFVFDDELHTPKPDGFLNGLTRQTVMSLAKSLGIKVVEREITPYQIGIATECFITGTAVEITAVNQISHRYYKTPGKITTLLYNAFHELVQKPECEVMEIIK